MDIQEVQRRLKELNALKHDGTVSTKEYLEQADKFRDDLRPFNLALIFAKTQGEYGIFNNED